MHRKRDRRAGFTLVEALIAMVIAAMGLAGIYQLYSGAARLEAAAQENWVMTRMAQSLLAEMGPVTPGAPSQGEAEGYAWTVNTNPSPEGVIAVELVLTAPSGRELRVLTARGEAQASGQASSQPGAP